MFAFEVAGINQFANCATGRRIGGLRHTDEGFAFKYAKYNGIGGFCPEISNFDVNLHPMISFQLLIHWLIEPMPLIHRAPLFTHHYTFRGLFR